MVLVFDLRQSAEDPSLSGKATPGLVSEIRPFHEAADLAEFLALEELPTLRDGECRKLGVA
ncbi:hypothetical protein RSO01_10750 [Reyranella soli]|uniref:Uncharacterized protein n=1 Tax=Reyranella soli TaxID=1230389 RepID=A0A512N4J9_9HYPH|nr:hypothetical protein RSO01_10750 [Reyranella soli]